MMRKIKVFFFFVGLLALGLFMLVNGVRDYTNSKRIIAQGKQTLGKVVDGEERRGRRGKRSYYLTVAFQTAAKQSVERELKVTRAVYDRAAAEGTVPVHYLPSDPRICAFGQKAETKFGTAVWGLLALIGSAVLLKGLFDFGAQPPGTGSSVASPANQMAASNSGDSETADTFEEAA